MALSKTVGLFIQNKWYLFGTLQNHCDLNLQPSQSGQYLVLILSVCLLKLSNLVSDSKGCQKMLLDPFRYKIWLRKPKTVESIRVGLVPPIMNSLSPRVFETCWRMLRAILVTVALDWKDSLENYSYSRIKSRMFTCHVCQCLERGPS